MHVHERGAQREGRIILERHHAPEICPGDACTPISLCSPPRLQAKVGDLVVQSDAFDAIRAPRAAFVGN